MENGIVCLYESYIRISVLDGFLEAERQDENWHDDDTINLIVDKLMGRSKIVYANK